MTTIYNIQRSCQNAVLRLATAAAGNLMKVGQSEHFHHHTLIPSISRTSISGLLIRLLNTLWPKKIARMSTLIYMLGWGSLPVPFSAAILLVHIKNKLWPDFLRFPSSHHHDSIGPNVGSIQHVIAGPPSRYKRNAFFLNPVDIACVSVLLCVIWPSKSKY